MAKAKSNTESRSMSEAQQFEAAFALQRAGKVEEAQAAYRNLLQQNPLHFDSLHLCGILEAQRRHYPDALDLFERAEAIKASDASLCSNKGNVLRELAEYSQAIASYRKAVELRPEYFEAWLNLGRTYVNVGDLETAAASFRRALLINPDDVDALLELADVAEKLRCADDVLQCFEKALKAAPDNVKVLRAAAEAYTRAKQLNLALACNRKIMKSDPDDWKNGVATANLLFKLGEYDEAEKLYQRFLDLQPNNLMIWNNRGNTLFKLEKPAEALVCFKKTLEIDPEYAEGYFNAGNAYSSLKMHNDALAMYSKALHFNPKHAGSFNNRGNIFLALKWPEDALISYESAIAYDPSHVNAHNNRGNALRELNRPAEALLSYDRALALDHSFSQGLNNRANALNDLMRPAEALEAYAAAIKMKPDYVEAQLGHALILLRTGQLERGFEQYEWRWKQPPLLGTRPDFKAPMWLGETSIAGKTILLWHEQGLGDTIQFCRYGDVLAEMGANVLIRVPEALEPLLAASSKRYVISKNATPLPHFDFHCPLLSLPLALKINLGSIHAPERYLGYGADRQARWQAILGERVRPRIGVAWSGSTAHANDRNRSISLDRFLRLANGPFDFCCLQKEIRPGDVESLKKYPNIRQFSDQIVDFEDTAALVDQMDLVISVDTSVAHLAGGLGRKLWLLLPYVPDWRWMLERRDTPWYPTARLYRQPRAGDWQTVLDTVLYDLGSEDFHKSRQ
jgi:tetratricopeptide (TPR) repeat protein